MVQTGFDTGYNERGAPIGSKYGFLLGSICALEGFAKKGKDSQKGYVDQITALKEEIRAIQLGQLVERDWEALEHEREHGADISHIQRETEEEKQQRESRLGLLQARVKDLTETVLYL
jgi:formiminotetrahydrofolate cyclodeaminase